MINLKTAQFLGKGYIDGEYVADIWQQTDTGRVCALVPFSDEISRHADTLWHCDENGNWHAAGVKTW